MTLIQLDPVRNHCQIRGAGLDSGPVTSSWVGLRSRQEVNVKSELEPEGQTTMAMRRRVGDGGWSRCGEQVPAAAVRNLLPKRIDWRLINISAARFQLTC